MDNELRVRVLLSIQRALLGEVFPALRAVYCAWDLERILVRCVIDGAISEEDAESVSCVETEVMADFPEMVVESECYRLDTPAPLTMAMLGGECAYRRRE